MHTYLAIVLSVLVASCISVPPHQTARQVPPEIDFIKTQIELYVKRSKGQHISVIENHAKALIDEHQPWIKKALVEFESRANAYDSVEPFVANGAAAAAAPILRFPILTLNSTSELRSGFYRNTPALLEIVALAEKYDEILRVGREKRAHLLQLKRMAELAAQDSARIDARQERAAKFDTQRRKKEQCNDFERARPNVEPTEAQMCGALLSDFDWRAKVAEETAGRAEELFFGSSPEKIKARGTLLVNLSGFKKHGTCSAGRKQNHQGYNCTYSVVVDYDDHALMRLAQAMSGGKPIMKRVQGFFYIGQNGAWQTDQE